MKLYTTHRSSAAYRVRIALAYKGLEYESEYVSLNKTTGDIRTPEYLEMNPQGMVPTLVEGRRVYRQSLAILEYLDEVYPHPSILPGNSRDRERIRSLSQVIVRDIDPLTEPRVIAYLKQDLELGNKACKTWAKHWYDEGMQALERLMADNPATSRFCHGDIPTMADICLVPQVKMAESLGWPLSTYPTIARIYHRCLELEAFRSTAPQLSDEEDALLE